MEIKDYLHFYIGQRCVTPFGVMVLSYFNPKSRYKAWFTDDYEENRGHLYENNVTGHAFFMTEFKPILRKLSDMTEEEKLKLYGMGFTHNSGGLQIEHPKKWPTFKPVQFQYLLSIGIDLFGLIDAGLAIRPPASELFKNSL